MENSKMICPECNGEMELGQLYDRGFMKGEPQSWVQGADNLFILDKEVEIKSYRCTKCGFLKNYAPDINTKDINKNMVTPAELKIKKK